MHWMHTARREHQINQQSRDEDGFRVVALTVFKPARGVPGNRIHAIVNGTRDITGDTDLRLCKPG
jgi:hypothetical protein